MKKLLFICMGNICRSPSAEAVMNAVIKKHGKENEIQCDSAGTIDYHQGEAADHRMKEHAIQRGYELTSISRPFVASDFKEFDWIIMMDDENMAHLKMLDTNHAFGHKLLRMIDFYHGEPISEVPDPYYGGSQGFEIVLDLLENACEGLFEFVNKKTG